MGNMAEKRETRREVNGDDGRETHDGVDSESMDTTEQQRDETNCGRDTAGRGKSKKNKDKNKKRQNKLERLEAENKNLEEEKASLNQELCDVRQQLSDCRTQHDKELVDVHRQLSEYRQQCEHLKDKNEAMLQRYSEVISNQLKANPLVQDITYLDEPRKIADAFRSEVYNKLWCEALDVVDTGVISERDQLEILRDLCRDSFLICTFVLMGQAENLRQALGPFPVEVERADGLNYPAVCPLTHALNKLPEVVREEFIQNSRQSKYLEKIVQEQCCSPAHATNILTRTYGEGIVNQVKPYISSCVHLCWDMLLQKPPMYLDFNMTKGCPVNPDVCDFYSYQGSKVEFLVWPVVYRHFGGPVLNKGIVQASSDEP